MNSLRAFFIELRRRRVLRLAGLYIVGSWVGVQVASLVFPAIDVGDEAIRYVWAIFLLGFPLALVFAWRYDITANGIVRTGSAGSDDTETLQLRPVDYVLLLLLLLLFVAMAVQVGDSIGRYGLSTDNQSVADRADPLTIIVLPFEDVSARTDQQYLADGLQDALISTLSGISALNIISRTSARIVGEMDRTPQQIGAELGAGHLIEGTVSLREGELRLSIHLVASTSGQVAWSRVFQRPLGQVLQLQSDLARSVAEELQVLLTPDESAYLSSARTVVPEAYEKYLLGRFHWYRFGANDLALARRYFEEAIELDPDSALAYVGLADAYATPAHVGLAPSTPGFPRAAQLVAKALELDERLAEAHDMAARLKFTWDYDWLAADRGFRESIRLKPGYADVRIVYSQFLGIQGRREESLDQARAGLALDPLNNWFRVELGARLSWFGRRQEALSLYRSIASEQPGWFMIHRHLWEIYCLQGRAIDALAAAGRYYALSGRADLEASLAPFQGTSEMHGAMVSLAEAMLAGGETAHVSEFEVARIYALAGDVARTIQWLQQAEQNRDSQLVYALADPVFELVWNEDWFGGLRDRLYRPQGQG